MKRFLTSMAEWKSAVCLMYTGSAVLYMVILLLLKAQPDLGVLFSLLLISILGSLIQMLAFTDRIIKRLRYSLRLLLFVVLFLPILTAFAILFQWFPVQNGGSWLVFVGIFLASFLIFTAGFELYFYVTGRKYDGILGQYKKQQEEKQ